MLFQLFRLPGGQRQADRPQAGDIQPGQHGGGAAADAERAGPIDLSQCLAEYFQRRILMGRPPGGAREVFDAPSDCWGLLCSRRGAIDTEPNAQAEPVVARSPRLRRRACRGAPRCREVVVFRAPAPLLFNSVEPSRARTARGLVSRFGNEHPMAAPLHPHEAAVERRPRADRHCEPRPSAPTRRRRPSSPAAPAFHWTPRAAACTTSAPACSSPTSATTRRVDAALHGYMGWPAAPAGNGRGRLLRRPCP